ncbi:MAG TPA: pseudaminic acid cytidylyltransferase [Kiritimatiellia bacterium]|nr:pseudaminic acid cytidylyltransferase [Kiritimatiellia bacterium]HRZ11473.1 pseudaminic acid cytidylyltransferase [Kiritimatiellia bacterium]HSA16976.1 pseudaminic acid cytidylyltransferase [Kiritimatiellia bacterium]
MKAVALIPARGGSKRIPGKNIKPFCGRPMIAYSIAAARDSRLFERILVSTDDEAIERVARDEGAEVPFRRPAELANDHAGTDDVLVHALDWLAGQGGAPRYVCCLYATAPFVTGADLQRGLDALQKAGAITAVSVTTFAYPILRALKVSATGRLEMFWPENRTRRSQDLPEAWHDAGQFYWLDVPRYRAEPRLFSSDSVPVPLPRHRVQDIDTPEDWARAEAMFQALLPSPS